MNFEIQIFTIQSNELDDSLFLFFQNTGEAREI